MLIEEEKITFRSVTIGDSSVGKTCIVNRFLQDKFDPAEPNTIGTLYESFTDHRDGHDLEIQIWDTAGQEQYRSLGPIYYRSSLAALVVFDITNRKSFDDINEWVSEFRSVAGENTIVLLVGNKIDLPERAVEKEEAQEWATKNNCIYMETSARNGTGVKQLFTTLVDELMKMYNGDDGMKVVSRSKVNTPDKDSQTEKKGGCC
ncbi:Ras family protein [Trichomonas vaginalis G3]|uniref:Ras family protein n=1 Tax=Trichomonas vaginalis (strain ATCC PRA-98 / G3) TaxID=412133 RepID=A2DAD5_TRIV3|nr:GTPase protein [Trichomonas vaginalis G3]EAY22783.1 Ras family protein [Trichomonas vaginalis G3]KAI5525594.1 GTPase protein [Trichomonas vaginalis G3]|eukprot:XP_001583769.1 Ras family protein [Trichomonas vaginalis G3]